MTQINPVRGTKDLLPKEKYLFNRIISISKKTAELYGYLDIETPIFEKSDVFSKPLGQTSDVVSKETYNFKDRNDELLTLRPEGTAAIMRAVLSNSLTQNLPLRWFYSGPMFRYERPQKGRMRQFHQIGCELIGSYSYLSDLEIISCSVRILKSLGLLKFCTLKINTLGDIESRKKYKEKLISYFKQNQRKLSEDSQRRLFLNPLRILDSKSTKDKEIIKNAPVLTEFLNLESREHYKKVLDTMKSLNVVYEEDNFLVRGLDYYTHTVFEFVTDKLGSQGTVLGGGRYNGLAEKLGGKNIPGVGFSAGIERIALIYEDEQIKNNKIALICLDDNNTVEMLKISEKIRNSNIFCILIEKGNLNKKMKVANKLGCNFVVICGPNEFKKGEYVLKDMDNGKQRLLKIKNIEKEINNFLNLRL